MTSAARPIHVGYLVQDFPPEVGAGPARATEMSHRWQSRGARVTVITGMPNRRIPGRGEGGVDPRYRGRWFMREDWEGIPTLRSWLYTGRAGFRTTMINNASFMITGLVHALARGFRSDVLIASSPPFLPHVSGLALSRLRGIPLVLEVRDLWPDYLAEMGVLPTWARKPLFALERALLRRAARVVVVTESFRQRIAAKGVPLERIEVISNGVDLEQYYPSEEPAPMPELERRGNERIVGYLGTFGRGQALAAVVQAVGRLRREGEPVRLVLVGDGPDMPAVREAIAELGGDGVTVHPPIPRTQTRAFYNACDVCVVPLAPLAIFQETVPSKIFEVMACGRPLVAALRGEGGRIVEESGGGIRAEPGDAASIAQALREVVAISAEQRADMGRRARAFVAHHYDRKMLADKYLSLLTDVTVARL